MRDRRRRVLVFAVGAAGALFLVSCDSQPKLAPLKPSNGSQAAVRFRDYATSALAEANGELHGDPRSGCIWLAGKRGRTSYKYQIVLVGPFTVAWHPLVIHERGHPDRRAGQYVTFHGGYVNDPAVPGCPVSPPRTGLVFGAG